MLPVADSPRKQKQASDQWPSDPNIREQSRDTIQLKYISFKLNSILSCKIFPQIISDCQNIFFPVTALYNHKQNKNPFSNGNQSERHQTIIHDFHLLHYYS